ncbi:hypothetical protein TRVL_03739 [Trypanosoma vivax]|uniref:Uncharacterized protein n=1 Tax=Trypanosoma vivax (strain Y486) TaxID=1055687 RepID=G0TSH1_TRYVY|nr:hypothetical protein TRVL_03739 [Trypanosoma vivax]CCC46898.1 hypothetical protein TVY486_0300900 [Trypanosoma vivax Y486]
MTRRGTSPRVSRFLAPAPDVAVARGNETQFRKAAKSSACRLTTGAQCFQCPLNPPRSRLAVIQCLHYDDRGYNNQRQCLCAETELLPLGRFIPHKNFCVSCAMITPQTFHTPSHPLLIVLITA